MPVNTRLNSKTRLVLVEKKRAKISEMLSTSVQCFLKYRLGFCCNWSFSRYLHRLLFHNVYQVLIKLYLIIHVNFFNFRKSLKKLLSRSLVVAEKELLTQPWRSKFQKGFFEKITISLKEVVLIEVHLLRDDSKQKKIKINTRNTITSSNHSKVRSHFSFVWVMEFSIISPYLGASKVFLKTLTWQT